MHPLISGAGVKGDFSLSYSERYSLFLSLTILVGVTFAFIWEYFARCYYATVLEHRSIHRWSWTRRFFNLLWIVSLEAAVALLTWAVSIYSTTNDQADIQGPPIELPGILLGIMLLWIPIALMTDFLYIQTGSTTRNHKAIFLLFTLFLTTVLIVLPGFVILTVHCKQMASIETFQLYGPMLITNVSVESFPLRGLLTQLRRRKTTEDSLIHVALLQVQWECPQQSTWCSTYMYEPDCVRCQGHLSEQTLACAQRGTAGNAEQCIFQKYNIWNDDKDLGMALFISSDERRHDETSKPNPLEQTSLSPTNELNLYGNCNDCHAMVASSYTFLLRHNKSLQDAGILLEFIGLCVYSVLAILVVVLKQVQKHSNDSTMQTVEGESGTDTERTEADQNTP